MLEAKEIKALMDLCVKGRTDLVQEQYSNGTYSRSGGDNAKYRFGTLYDKLSVLYEEVHRAEIRQEVLAELGVTTVTIR